MRDLILGHGGFLSNHLYNYLKKKNKDVYVMSRKKFLEKNFFKVDFKNTHKINQFFFFIKPDRIWNMIGSYTNNLDKDLEANFEITRNVLNSQYNLYFKPKILLIGSAAEYGIKKNKKKFSENDSLNPINNYGLSKALQTQYSIWHYKNFNSNIIIARIFNVFGPNISSKLFFGQIQGLLDGRIKKIKILKNCSRDYSNYLDILKKIYKVMTRGKRGEIYNVASGIPTSNYKFFKSYIKSKKIDIKKLNYSLVRLPKNTVYANINKLNKL